MIRTTRLAPSPTGALHLGNARTFLANWLLARRQGWRIVLRIEDLDGPRIKPGADRQLIADLHWLGLDWDEGPIYQSARLDDYQRAIERLMGGGRVYPCVCSRREVDAAASAPHSEDGAAVYPGTCRGKYASVQAALAATGRPPALRFGVTDDVVEFNDYFAGPQRFDVARQLGDFVVAKSDAGDLIFPSPGKGAGGGLWRQRPPRDGSRGGENPHPALSRSTGRGGLAAPNAGQQLPLGTPAYQLAVVVDDAQMGITDVVRGDDLLDSTPRQILLYRALGLSDCIPNYYHLPLVIGADGRRLAKRHGDTRLSAYRERGVTAARIRALLARWCGIESAPPEARPHDLLERFQLDRIPRKPTVFSAEDDRRLICGGV